MQDILLEAKMILQGQCLRMGSSKDNTFYPVRATKNRSQKEEHKRRVIQALEALILEGGALNEEFT